MYPTAKEIMEKPFDHSANTIYQVFKWKEESYDKGKWKKAGDSKHVKTSQLFKLQNLVIALSLKEKEVYPRIGLIYCYQPSTKSIYLDKDNPSILSTLHEIAHYTLGPDELEACRWSVWLFKECFPEAFQKLEWKGHMLVKPYV